MLGTNENYQKYTALCRAVNNVRTKESVNIPVTCTLDLVSS